MRFLLSLAASAAIILAAPAARADQGSKSVTYHTVFHQIHVALSSGDQAGVLRLTFWSDGIVSGSYNPAFNSEYTLHVDGGLQGSKLWLSIGASKFQGTVQKDGTISGTVWNYRGPDTFAFTAIPDKRP